MTAALKFIDAPSPNFDARGAGIDTVILHYTGMQTGAEAVARLRDPAAKVSAHYAVEENGDIYRLVDEQMRAWHAGVGSWKGDIDINARSIGIEIVNPGHEWGYRAFPKAQVASVISLLKDIRTRHPVKPARVLAHSDVAPRRKEDPGEKFPWAQLAAEGVALAPYEGDASAGLTVSYVDALRSLSDIGYDAPAGDHAAGLLAFQRRFCPQSLGQGFDPRTRAALMAVAKHSH
ncbi:N-acetylmuramoyl-L-alanine amidase [Hyphococcus sp.]|uniref:N-acetylmuramoyl-L-alanine amidase n=1 Tax=Hyphococcus sp. TaxID=2038636 RepID=UPI00208B5908|nr:MAG: N-acetyl-anhydromuramyl-L-alanine amidase [Marinicaulis sp.]